MSLRLGCVADDYTGATDLGAMLARAGRRVLLMFGQPSGPLDPSGCDAAIVALKSRSIPAAEAVGQSLAALRALREAGAERFFFKYCSTFDSTDAGNIGPVAEAMADELEAERVLFCPAFPENGRTVYRGHLFVHGRPLHESSLRNHPLNPMTDPDLVRVLGRQATRAVGLLPYEAIESGADAVRAALAETLPLVIADALTDAHLATVAEVIRGDKLVTGGSAVARWLVAEGGAVDAGAPPIEPVGGHAAVISGSCSEATRRQVAAFAGEKLPIDPVGLADETQSVESIAEWASDHFVDGPVLLHSTADPRAVEDAKRVLGAERALNLVEDTLGEVARALVDWGVRRLVVAGGETSGAVLRELAVEAVRIGPEIAPGVPWVETTGAGPRLALALKSGNFGADDFFAAALEKQS